MVFQFFILRIVTFIVIPFPMPLAPTFLPSWTNRIGEELLLWKVSIFAFTIILTPLLIAETMRSFFLDHSAKALQPQHSSSETQRTPRLLTPSMVGHTCALNSSVFICIIHNWQLISARLLLGIWPFTGAKRSADWVPNLFPESYERICLTLQCFEKFV